VWRDLAVRRRRTEVDAHFAPILAHASDLGLSAPLLAPMVQMIHEVEDGTHNFGRSNLEELASAARAPTRL
jgi:2-dehydropantoate 2-reductase